MDESELLKVMVVCADRSGPFYHDVGIPIKYFTEFNILNMKAWDYINMDELKQADLVWFQRQYAPDSIITLRKVKDMGVITIAHVDDNIWELPISNPAHSTYSGDTLARFNQLLREADAVTTSTPYLKSLCLKYNPNVWMLRNIQEMGIVNFKSEGRDNPDEIRVGWTGTMHHHDDILIAEHALKEISRKYPQVKLVFMGYAPPHIAELVPRNRWEYYDFVPVESFYPCFVNLDFDIGIAPLADNHFNWGKTGRKPMEYGALSIPMVLSPVQPYLKWIEADVALGPKKNRHLEWVKDLSSLIESKELRDEYGARGHKYAGDNYDVTKFIVERAQLYYDIYAFAKKIERKVIWEGDVRDAERAQ